MAKLLAGTDLPVKHLLEMDGFNTASFPSLIGPPPGSLRMASCFRRLPPTAIRVCPLRGPVLSGHANEQDGNFDLRLAVLYRDACRKPNLSLPSGRTLDPCGPCLRAGEVTWEQGSARATVPRDGARSSLPPRASRVQLLPRHFLRANRQHLAAQDPRETAQPWGRQSTVLVRGRYPIRSAISHRGLEIAEGAKTHS